MEGTVKRYTDPSALARAAADLFVKRAGIAIGAHGTFRVVLSGGSTPAKLFRLLATAPYAGFIDWPRVHLYWGDERCVPPTDADSNYRMTRETLLDHVPLPPENVHRIHGELPPQVAAAQYAWLLKEHFGDVEAPRFDLVFLGMGGDGHTASLFPGSAAVAAEVEQTPERWVAANHVPALDVWRVTMTSVPLNAAAYVAFLVAGTDKAQRLHDVIFGPYQPIVWPAQLIQPASGELVWMIDAEAGAWLATNA